MVLFFWVGIMLLFKSVAKRFSTVFEVKVTLHDADNKTMFLAWAGRCIPSFSLFSVIVLSGRWQFQIRHLPLPQK